MTYSKKEFTQGWDRKHLSVCFQKFLYQVAPRTIQFQFTWPDPSKRCIIIIPQPDLRKTTKQSAIENQQHIKERATIRKCDGPAADESGLFSSARLMHSVIKKCKRPKT